jgi:hypothetical protein
MRTKEPLRVFAGLATPASYHIATYVPRQYDRWIFPKILTKINFGSIIVLSILIAVLVVLFSLIITVYVAYDIYINPTLGWWSHVALFYIAAAYLLAIMWLIRSHVPLPFEDMSKLKELEQLRTIDPDEYKRRLLDF